MTPRIALSGYYGCGNTGDEAVLEGIIESFCRRAGLPRERFVVFSADPAQTERQHAVRAIERMRPPALRAALREVDLLVSGGGSLLQDTTSLRSLLYYLWVVRLGRSAGRPVMFYAQGIGPLRRRAARILTRIVADRVQMITVRDPASAALLRQIGVRRPPIEVTADPAFALRPVDPETVAGLLGTAGALAGEPLVGVALRPWGGEAPPVEAYARMADALIDRTGMRLLFLPMQPPGDLALSEQVVGALRDPARALVLRAPLGPREAVGVIGALQGLVAMRLHALIFGAMGGVPLVALDYDPKVTHLMALLGEEARAATLDLDRLSEASERLATALEGGEALRGALRMRADALAERALVNVDRALATVKSA